MGFGQLQGPGPGVGEKCTGIPPSPETLPASRDRGLGWTMLALSRRDMLCSVCGLTACPSLTIGGIGNSPRLWTRVARHLFPIIGILCVAVVALAVCCGELKGRKCPDHRDLTPLNYFEPPCLEHWLWYLGTCYFFSEDEGSWAFANKSCWEMNSSLALIDSAQPTLELTFMLRYKGSSDHWIGLKRTLKKFWQWPDGSNFNNQFAVEGDSDCAYLNEVAVGSGRCYNKRNWICTKKQWKN